MNGKLKGWLTIIAVAICAVVIGGGGGTWLANNYQRIPPWVLAVVALALLVFGGLGKGIYSLANALNYNCPKLFAYLPFTQDVVVHSAVKSIRDNSSLRQAITKVNLLLVSTVLIVVDAGAVVLNNSLTSKTLAQAQDDATIHKILNLHSMLLTGIIATVLFAWIIRVLYFNYIFKTAYRNPVICLLGILPPVQVILIALLHNQLGYMRHQHDREKAKGNRGGKVQRPVQSPQARQQRVQQTANVQRQVAQMQQRARQMQQPQQGQNLRK